MTRMIRGAVAALALLALPALAHAQRPGGPGAGDMQRMLETNPLWQMLEARERLALTEAQATQINAMAKALDEENAPHIAKVREMRARMPARGEGRPSPEAREKMRAAMETTRPAMQAIRESHQTAMQEARKLLSEDQTKTLDEMQRELRQQRPRRRGPPRG